jgi:hypothetical protein
MNTCRILHEPGAAGKSVCSFRLPPTLRPAERARGDGVPPPRSTMRPGTTCPAAAVLAGLSWNG